MKDIEFDDKENEDKELYWNGRRFMDNKKNSAISSPQYFKRNMPRIKLLGFYKSR